MLVAVADRSFAMGFIMRCFIVCGLMVCGSLQGQPVNNWQIKGLDEELSQNVTTHLENKRFDCLSLQKVNSQQRQGLVKQVRRALQPFGYFNPTTQIYVPTDGDCAAVTVTTDPGPITTITQLNLEVTGAGADLPDWKDLAATQGIIIGQALRQPAYDELKKQWQSRANELLYLNARFQVQQLRVNADLNEAAIELSFDTGQRFRLNQVRVMESPQVLDVDLLSQMMPFQTGQYLSRQKLYAVQQKLNSTGYFSAVKFEVVKDPYLSATFDLIVHLTPAAKYDYSAGFGYSTDSGARSSFKYNNHRVNRLGHQYTINVQSSELANDLTMTYKLPGKDRPLSHWYGVQLAYKDEQTEQVDREVRTWGISETRIDDNGWQNINYIDWIQESFDTGSAQGKTILYVPGTSWSLTRTDDVSRPMNGHQWQADFKFASDDLLSDASFAQLSLRGKYIHSLGQGNRLLYRLHIGSTASSDFEQLPTSYRFYTGGDQSIRGYDFEEISPINEKGDAIGGKHLLAGSIEYEHPLAEQWAAAVFTDFGDAFNDAFELKQSVGAGVRWFSPIGPIRLDLARSVKGPASSLRVHITVGPDL